jgi:hypothetical protein
MKKTQKDKKRKNLLSYTKRFYSVTGLPYIHTIQERIENEKSLRPEDFNSH